MNCIYPIEKKPPNIESFLSPLVKLCSTEIPRLEPDSPTATKNVCWNSLDSKTNSKNVSPNQPFTLNSNSIPTQARRWAISSPKHSRIWSINVKHTEINRKRNSINSKNNVCVWKENWNSSLIHIKIAFDTSPKMFTNESHRHWTMKSNGRNRALFLQSIDCISLSL